MQQIYDYVIIGSGFGGSVSAMRLTEKGYSVLVLEKGKHFEDKDFAKFNLYPERSTSPYIKYTMTVWQRSNMLQNILIFASARKPLSWSIESRPHTSGHMPILMKGKHE